jgi:hypothetical protein
MEPSILNNNSSGKPNFYNSHQQDYDYSGSGWIYDSGTITTTGLTISNNNNIMQNKVAVFKVTRDENQKITSSKFIKELWIESKNGSSIDFEVAKDTEISKFEANEIIIKVIHTFTL